MKIAVKRVGKPLEIVETNQKYRTNAVREYIKVDEHKTCEYVCLNSEYTFSLGVNEVGLMLELPTNFLIHTSNPYFPIQKMVGTVVFVRTLPLTELDPYDYEVADLTNDDLNYINSLLSKDYQLKLEEEFDDYGKGYAIFEKIF